MKKDELIENIDFFKESDGLLFNILSCFRNGEKLKLKKIVFTGESIDFDIISLKDINEGLSRFESLDYLEIREGRIFFKEKFKAFEKNNKQRFENMIDKQVRYRDIFKNLKITKKVEYKIYFEESEYNQMINNLPY